MIYKFSSFWPEIKQFYSIILYNTSRTVDTSTFINFWNDKWCSTTSLANIAGLCDCASILDTDFHFGLVVIGIFSCLYNRCLVFLIISWLDRNRISLTGFQMSLVVSLLNRLRLFSWNQEFPMARVNSFGVHIFFLPKLQYSGKFFMGGFLHFSIFRINVCIYVLYVRFVRSTRNLFNNYFFEYFNALHI